MALALLSGCGDGALVPASGKLTVEGEPVGYGRLSVRPVGPGIQSASLVAEDGGFVLRTEGKAGVPPGSYHVLYKTDLALNEAAGQGALAPPAGEVSVLYKSPRSNPLEISPEGSDALVINISKDEGWVRSLSE